MDKIKEVQDLEAKNAKLETIISELEHNAGWRELINLVSDDIKVLDDTWHWIPEDAAARRMEARATKMAYTHLINIINICKDDLKRSLDLIEEIKSTEIE